MACWELEGYPFLHLPPLWPLQWVPFLFRKPFCKNASVSRMNSSPHHRLNGSSSPVLTATSLSYGKAKNSTPHRIKTPHPIEIKFGTVDYVGEGTRHAKFYANSSKGASRQMGEIYAKIFIYICLFFFRSPTDQTFSINQSINRFYFRQHGP